MALHPMPQEHTCCPCVDRLNQDNARLKAGGFQSWSEADRAIENANLRKELFDLRAHVAALVDHGLAIVTHFNRCGGAGLQPAIDALDDLCRRALRDL